MTALATGDPSPRASGRATDATHWRAVSRRMRDEEAVFVVGVPRSGTTALRHTLDQHPAFRARQDRSPETRVFANPDRVEEIRAESARPAFRYLLESDEAAEALLADVASMRLPAAGLRRLAAGWMGRSRAGAAADARWRLLGRHHLLRLYFHHAKQVRGCRRILEKTPHHVFFVDEIFSTFPKARILVCVRHPVDVYSSFRKRLARDRLAGRDERRLRWLAEDVDKFVKRYRRIATTALGQIERRPGRLHPVRYEELTADPRRTLEEICRFLGELFDADALLGGLEVERDAHGSPVPQKRIVANEKRWEEFLGRDEAARIEARLSPVIERLGYRPYTTAAGSPAPAAEEERGEPGTARSIPQ